MKWTTVLEDELKWKENLCINSKWNFCIWKEDLLDHGLIEHEMIFRMFKFKVLTCSSVYWEFYWTISSDIVQWLNLTFLAYQKLMNHHKISNDLKLIPSNASVDSIDENEHNFDTSFRLKNGLI